MSNEPMTARHLIIHGQVQGVFYRDWTVEMARSLGRRVVEPAIRTMVHGR